MQQSMCLLEVNRLPLKWKTYKVPSEKVVHYSCLLKQKREFQQFINRLGTQVFSMGSCYIIEKMCSVTCEKDMIIYIFDETEYCKSLQLKILIPKQHLLKKISLLIHLTSKNNAVSRFENLCMFIKCKEGTIWETFYNFFEFLLKKSSLNLIGTQFYVPLVCKYMITNERRLLHSCSSKIISANTKQTLCSVYKSPFPSTFAQGCVNNCVKILELPVQKTGVTTCELKNKLWHEDKQNPLNMTLKRKSINFENYVKVKTVKVSHEFCKKLTCKCHERNKWKVFKQISQCSIVNYTDLLKTDNSFNDSEFSQIHSFQSETIPVHASSQVHENNGFQLSSSEKLFSKLEVTKNVELALNSSPQVMNITPEINLFETEKLENKKESEQLGELYAREKNKITSNIFPQIGKDDSSSQCYLHHNKKKSQEIIEMKQNMDIPNNILILNECKKIDVEPIPAVITPKPHSKSFCAPSTSFQRMSMKEHVNTDNLSKGFLSISSGKLNVSSQSFQTSSKSDCNVTNKQSMGFQTAAGKSLNISEKAFLAAQKMFEEVSSQEINLLHNDASEDTLPNNPAFKKPAYPDESYLDNDFNSDFAEKFFEEIPFDDKEVEIKQKVDVMQSPLPNLNTGKSQVGKVRKSLGGRRSLKPYAIKK